MGTMMIYHDFSLGIWDHFVDYIEDSPFYYDYVHLLKTLDILELDHLVNTAILTLGYQN